MLMMTNKKKLINLIQFLKKRKFISLTSESIKIPKLITRPMTNTNMKISTNIVNAIMPGSTL